LSLGERRPIDGFDLGERFLALLVAPREIGGRDRAELVVVFVPSDRGGGGRGLAPPALPFAIDDRVQAPPFLGGPRGEGEEQQRDQKSLHKASMLISRAPSSRTRMVIPTCPSSNSSTSRFGHSISFTPGPASSSGMPISSHSRRFSDSR